MGHRAAGRTLLLQLRVAEAVVIQLPSACLEGSRPGWETEGGIRVRNGEGGI